MTLEEKVIEALESVRPQLQHDGGDLEFISVSEEGQVSVKLLGACNGCPMATMTLKQGIEAYLKEQIPEITEVVQVF